MQAKGYKKRLALSQEIGQLVFMAKRNEVFTIDGDVYYKQDNDFIKSKYITCKPSTNGAEIILNHGTRR